MARTLQTIQMQAILKATVRNTLTNGDPINAPQGEARALAFVDGTGEGQSDRFWYAENRTLLDTVSEDLDVYDLAAFDIGGGAGKDALGQTWALVEATALMVYNNDSSTGNLIIGNKASAAAWNDPFNGDDEGMIKLPPDGVFLIACRNNPAWAVADSSNHLLKFLASGGNCSFNVMLMGRSA